MVFIQEALKFITTSSEVIGVDNKVEVDIVNQKLYSDYYCYYLMNYD